MRVEILRAFEVDTASGTTRYEAGQIVGNGQRNWVDKGLAAETTPESPKEASPASDKKSAETPKG